MVLKMGVEILLEPFKYDFMIRSFVAALLSGTMLSVLGTFTINKNMGWCDDINDPKKYNKLIQINKTKKCEKLKRADYKYDLLIPIKYNFKFR